MFMRKIKWLLMGIDLRLTTHQSDTYSMGWFAPLYVRMQKHYGYIYDLLRAYPK